jgi:hypothetical protein
MAHPNAKLKSNGDKAFWTGSSRKMFTYPDFTMFHLNTSYLARLISWVHQTLWERCTTLPSSLNHKLPWSLWIADVLSHCIHIFFSSILPMRKIRSVVDLLHQNACWWSPMIASMCGLNLERRTFIKLCMKLTAVTSHDNHYCQFYCPFCEVVQ